MANTPLEANKELKYFFYNKSTAFPILNSLMCPILGRKFSPWGPQIVDPVFFFVFSFFVPRRRHGGYEREKVHCAS